MANNLNPLQNLAFEGPDFDIGLVERRGYLIDPDDIKTEITQDVHSWGSVNFELYNLHPGKTGTADMPLMTWSVDNSTREYTPGRPTGAWGLFRPSEFRMQFTVYEFITTHEFQAELDGDPAPWNLANMILQVNEVELSGDEAIITATSRVSFLMDRFWDKDDSNEIDWTGVGGNTETILPG